MAVALISLKRKEISSFQEEDELQSYVNKSLKTVKDRDDL